ncbi:hypothetical protein ACWHA6_36295 [Streptomyces anthocyanicus]
MTYHFKAVFPVTEDGMDMTQADLIREAQNGPLADLLWESDAVLIGVPEWHLETAEDGSTFLAVEGPARRWDDKVDYRGRDWVGVSKTYQHDNSPAANRARAAA